MITQAEGGPIHKVVIVGGGTAGWMTAAALGRLMGRSIRVELVESEAIGIIGVGEATLPHIRYFIQKIGIDEGEFIRATHATIKLGIEFVNWGAIGEAYFHPFGAYGIPQQGVRFHQCWRKLAGDGEVGSLSDYSLPIQMAYRGRFQRPSMSAQSIESTFGYAYQFDATLFAPLLRHHAEAAGAKRTEGVVDHVALDPQNGNIRSLTLADGRVVKGDLFIDCSGFAGLLIGGALGVGYENWSHWLPCDRAIAAPSESVGPPAPYTRATAHDAGWQWRIPLQHRTGNGYVYSTAFTNDEAAKRTLERHVEGQLLAEPRILKFVPGRRRRTWHRNCVAIGLAGGFLEPLESTSLYLVQQAITELIALFPATSGDDLERDIFNARMDTEFERARDFLILHYHATRRNDAPMWNHVRTMDIPDTLAAQMALFQARGRAEPVIRGIFEEASWLAVLYGQGIVPQRYDQRVDAFPRDQLKAVLLSMKDAIAETAARMPRHEKFLAEVAAGA